VSGTREVNPSQTVAGIQRRVTAGFAVTAVGALAFAVVYALGGQVQLEGVTLGVAFLGLAYGFAKWVQLMPPGPYVEEREPMESPPEQRELTEDRVLRTDEAIAVSPVARRTFAFSVTLLGVALLFPLRSLHFKGPRKPVTALAHAGWRDGVRVVTDTGDFVRPGDLAVGTSLTVFPANAPTKDDAQTLLLRVDPARLALPAERRGWTVDGIVAYSKLCTHAGCPVGLYTDVPEQLLCPCHQSLFDVLSGAKPVFGPAPRPLPQLPLGVDGDGYLIARGDFSAPPGPGFWSEP
jgi:ubiquinol-cytochrome c reductase iron-sulfur subunit